VKNLLHNMPEYKRMLPEAAENLDQVAAAGLSHDRELMKSSASTVRPLRHKVVIEKK
jgi:hypothetical protein